MYTRRIFSQNIKQSINREEKDLKGIKAPLFIMLKLIFKVENVEKRE
jgi:hypothetical protein